MKLILPGKLLFHFKSLLQSKSPFLIFNFNLSLIPVIDLRYLNYLLSFHLTPILLLVSILQLAALLNPYYYSTFLQFMLTTLSTHFLVQLSFCFVPLPTLNFPFFSFQFLFLTLPFLILSSQFLLSSSYFPISTLQFFLKPYFSQD